MYGKLLWPVMARVDIDTACRRHPRECGSWISTLELDGNLYFLLRVTPVGSIHFVWGQAKFSEFILKMTKFNKLNLAWPSWLHSIPEQQVTSACTLWKNAGGDLARMQMHILTLQKNAKQPANAVY